MSDREPSAGFSLHLADIAVSELCAACDEAGPVPRDALEVSSAFAVLLSLSLILRDQSCKTCKAVPNGEKSCFVVNLQC